MIKRTDCIAIVDGKGKRGMLLGWGKGRFFRLAPGEESVAGHMDFSLKTPDVSVILEDNVLIVPKEGEPYLDIDMFADDPMTNMKRVPMTAEQSAKIKDRTRYFIEVDLVLRGDIYDEAKLIAARDGYDLLKWLQKAVRTEIQRGKP